MKARDEHIKHFKVVAKELIKLEVNSVRVDFSIIQPYEVELKYINPLINVFDALSKVFDEIEEKYTDKLTDDKKYILADCQRIFQIITEKSANCKSTLKSALIEGNFTKAEDEYTSIFSTLFMELIDLMHICIKYYSKDGIESDIKYSTIIIAEAMKEDFEISKSYENIISNIDYIKDELIQLFVS